MDKANCSACGAEIYWIRTLKGARMPVNVAKKMIMVHASEGRYHAVTGHESHFSSCPKASDFRKPKET